jgi:hypothetical protein
MALQKINWTQIDSANVPSGALIDIGAISGSLHAGYFDNLIISGVPINELITANADLTSLNSYTASLKDAIQTTGSNLTVLGDLLVKGTTTIIQSQIVQLDDNVIELNGSAGAFGGLLVKDTTDPNQISGSLLWDTLNDMWIAGPLGDEKPIATEPQLTFLSTSVATLIDEIGIFRETSSFYATTNDLQITGSVIIRGDLRVEGGTTMVQTTETKDTLTVSGAMSIVKNMVNNQIVSASLSIQNLGVLADRNQNAIFDCGDGFF